jgi:hypothetical protein
MTMQVSALLVAAAMMALCPGPAAALSLCPDEEGNYVPDACDLLWPFEPNPRRVECELEDLLAGELHPVCLDYYRKHGVIDDDLLARLGVHI